MKSAFFAATALITALMVGCKDEPKKPAASPAPAAAPATEPATPATEPATPATQPSSVTPGLPGLPGAADLPTPPAIPSAPSTPTPSSADVPGTAAGAAEDVQTKAKNWLAQADKALKAGKFGDAQQIVDKLNGIKASLSPEWQEKINQLSSAVDKAKTLKVPGLNN
jgi:hypothetical protein